MPNFRLKPIALSLLCLFSPHIYADESNSPSNAFTQINPASSESEDGSVFVDADEFDGYSEKEISARGNVKIRKNDRVISADEAHYDVNNEQVTAKGRVRIEQGSDSLEGTELQFNLQSETGYLDKPSFMINESQARGEAEKILFEGNNTYRITKTTYTTCPVGKDDWYLKVRDMELDKTRQVGTARDTTIVFKGVPILYTPWIDFPLNNQRKSGLLIPSFGSTAKRGIEMTIPYYWNMAPNRDITFSPRVMTKRGVQLNTQFRYLDYNYLGELNWDTLPNDRVTNTNRYGVSYRHSHAFGNNWSGNIDYQQVSDDTYFVDLADRISATSQTNLPHDVWLSYNVDRLNFTSRIQRFQTLQDPFAPVVPPYDRLPQLTFNASKSVKGAELVLNSELVRFEHPTLTKGDRFILYPHVSYPLYSAFGYFTPKVGMHMTRYVFDSTTTSLPDQSRSVPIFSLESGVTFERDWEFRGDKFIQTLEPKAYYVYIPYREQNALPNFDSAISDFNFAQIFTENQFSGGDRINDANQITLALTSRLLEPDTGQERLRAIIGQRFYFKEQEVTLNTPPRNDTLSDTLFALSGRISPSWLIDFGMQYNPNNAEAQKFSIGTRYQPELGKVLNLGYRYLRDSINPIRQLDISGQWPLAGRWVGVGRWNYSLLDSRILESIAGVEYNGGCWVFRAVVQRLATGARDSTSAFFFQLELNDLSKIGSNPLDLLRRNISGYTKINDPVVTNPAGRQLSY